MTALVLVMLTVACYTISSLGDKHISSKLNCNPAEFAFIVSFATAVWIGVTILFSGWGFEADPKNILILCFLVCWKIMEFYTSAVLLKTISAYELKAWLGLNIAGSYICNLFRGINQPDLRVLVTVGVLFAGIVLIVRG